jgi:hypothetical protein
MLDEDDKLLSLMSVGCTVDEKLVELPPLQSDEEASYDGIWQGFIGRELLQQSPMTTKKCLLQIVRVDYMYRFFYGSPDKTRNIKKNSFGSSSMALPS